MTEWKTNNAKALADALLSLSTTDDMLAFLRDLLTEAEIKEFAGRFAAARELAAGKSQRDVAKSVGISLMTVTRVNKWLKKGMGGYKRVLALIDKK